MSYMVGFISEQQHHRPQITQSWHRVQEVTTSQTKGLNFTPSNPKTLPVAARWIHVAGKRLRLQCWLFTCATPECTALTPPPVCIYRACSGPSNWATVCLNAALRAKGNTDVSGLTCRCKNLFAPQRTRRLGWQIHVNTHVIKAAGRSDSGRCSGKSFEWSWLGGDLRGGGRGAGQLMQEQVDPAERRYFPLPWWKHRLDSAH